MQNIPNKKVQRKFNDKDHPPYQTKVKIQNKDFTKLYPDKNNQFEYLNLPIFHNSKPRNNYKDSEAKLAVHDTYLT